MCVHLMQRYSKEGALTSVLGRVLAAVEADDHREELRPTRNRVRDKLSAEDRRELVRAFVECHETKKALSRRFGISEYSVRMILLQAGADRRLPRLRPEDIQQIWDLSASGLSALELSRRLKVPDSTIHLVLAAARGPAS